MDITMGIAQTSMELATARLTEGVQTAVLKNVMDTQKEALAILLQSMGMGQQLDIRAYGNSHLKRKRRGSHRPLLFCVRPSRDDGGGCFHEI